MGTTTSTEKKDDGCALYKAIRSHLLAQLTESPKAAYYCNTVPEQGFAKPLARIMEEMRVAGYTTTLEVRGGGEGHKLIQIIVK